MPTCPTGWLLGVLVLPSLPRQTDELVFLHQTCVERSNVDMEGEVVVVVFSYFLAISKLLVLFVLDRT